LRCELRFNAWFWFGDFATIMDCDLECGLGLFERRVIGSMYDTPEFV
jgi:hypothetical protein